jgi:hypothetical protein
MSDVRQTYQQYYRQYYKDRGYCWQRWNCLNQLLPSQRHDLWETEKKLGHILVPGNICVAFGLPPMRKAEDFPIAHWKQKILSTIDTVTFKENLDQDTPPDVHYTHQIDYAVLNAGITT